MTEEWRHKFVTRLVTPLMDTGTSVSVRRGYTSALGALPTFFLESDKTLASVVDALFLNTKIEKIVDHRDAETRRNATTALGRLSESLSDTGTK